MILLIMHTAWLYPLSLEFLTPSESTGGWNHHPNVWICNKWSNTGSNLCFFWVFLVGTGENKSNTPTRLRLWGPALGGTCAPTFPYLRLTQKEPVDANVARGASLYRRNLKKMTLGPIGVPLDFLAPIDIIPNPLNKQVTHATLPRNKQKNPWTLQTGSIYFDKPQPFAKTNL